MFAEVYARSCFSFIEGASQPEDLVEQAVALGLPAIGILDRDGIYGVARAESRLRRREKEGKSVPKLLVGADFTLPGTEATVALVAENARGYATLCRLLTEAHRDKGKDASTSRGVLNIQRENLPTEGLLALLGAPYDGGVTARVARLFAGRTHLVAHRHLVPDDRRREREVEALAAHFRLPIVASARPIFHATERRRLADVLACVRLGVTLDEAHTRLASNVEARLRSADEMRAVFRDKPRWVEASMDIAARCDFRMRDLGYRFPCFSLREGESADEALRRLAYEHLPRRYPSGAPPSVRDQIEKELGLILALGVASYFLCVWEIVLIARQKGILCQGRGSAANSAVCFVLGITSVDPARSSLLFERFLSVERDEPPDIDVDFEHERREEVIQAIYERYGRDRAAMVSNVICYRGKSALREVGKAFGLSPEQTDRLAGTVLWHDAGDANHDRVREQGLDPNDPRLAQVLELSSQIQGIPRHLGIHSGGFVLSATNLAEVAPVQPARMEGRTVVPWDKDDLDVLGFFKVDVLALGMLTALRKTMALVRGNPPDFDAIQALAEIPPEVPAVYDAFCKADTVGIFQIESRAQMAMLPNLKPRRFYDLVIEVAIVRPGPIQGGMVHPYLRRRAGKEAVVMPHPCLAGILDRTLGVPLFQEQVMQIAMTGGGYSGGQADELRRDMAAWKRSGRLERHRDMLLVGFRKKGISDAFSAALFEQIKGFGEYGFPESHAASFALLVYASGWLKITYPAAFAAALVNSHPMGFYSPSAIFQDAQRHGVEVRPLSIVASEWDCTLEHDKVVKETDQPAIRLGFRLVKGLSRRAADAIVGARLERPFSHLEDLVDRAALRKNEVEALAEAGALRPIIEARREAMWQSRVPRIGGLFEKIPLVEQRPALPSLSRAEQLVLDYDRTGLSVTDHPLAVMRPRLTQLGVRSHAVIRDTAHGTRVVVAGIVQSRQRPETASGVVFVTLEDETGWTNLVLWARVFEQFRTVVLGSRMLVVHGKLEREGLTIHVIAEKISRLTDRSLGQIRSSSRDFHLGKRGAGSTVAYMRLHLLALAPLVPFALIVACSSSGGEEPFAGRNNSTSRGGSSSSSRGGSTGTSKTDQICVPAATRACDCAAEDQVGFETCDAKGAAWGTCVCKAEAGGSGGAGGGKAGAAGTPSNGGSGGAANGGEAGSSAGEGGAGGKDPFEGDGGQGGEAGGPTGCTGGPDDDVDGDGWTPNQGDCNDCSNVVNPGAVDKADDKADNDCDGTVDNAPTACDAGLGPVVGDPANAARAIGICSIGVPPEGSSPVDRKWGLIASSFSGIAGQFLSTPPKSGASIEKQLGILPNFGSATPPQEGVALFSLSSGIARATGQAGAAFDVCGDFGGPEGQMYSGQSNYPPGFPKNGDCGTQGPAFDGIALDMSIRVPTNAKGFKVRLKFFTCEYPQFTCQVYNDVFAILMTPSPLMAGDPMADATNASANIAFETTAGGTKNVIGVNNTSFLTACNQTPLTSKYGNCSNEAGLAGSGFEGHAASSWLTTTVPLPAFPPGADRVIRLRFAIWDSQDPVLDSTAAVDGFEWETEAPKDTITRVEN